MRKVDFDADRSAEIMNKGPQYRYQVVARRTTVYEVEAANAQDAIEQMINGEGKEVDGNTEQIDAVVLCPTCNEPATDRTTREVGYATGVAEEAWYCDTCDREIGCE